MEPKHLSPLMQSPPPPEEPTGPSSCPICSSCMVPLRGLLRCPLCSFVFCEACDGLPMVD